MAGSETDVRYVVLKFGGTSVADRASWDTIAAAIRSRVTEGFRPFVVCSAVRGISDELVRSLDEAPRGVGEAAERIERRHLAVASELGVDPAIIEPPLEELKKLWTGISMTGEVTPRLHARVMAQGELLSTRLGVAFLEAQGLSVQWLDARDLLMAQPEPSRPTDRQILDARCVHHADPALQDDLAGRPSEAFVTQGFIARDGKGTVLLGRGGSDTSAAYFAAKLNAERCEIWTDVPGAFTADPRLVPQARLIQTLAYDEAQELASMGAKVLHPRCIAPLERSGIPLEIRWTAHPDADHTTIARATSQPRPTVKAITARNGVMLVSMDTPGMWQQVGFLADVFTCFGGRGLSVDLVSTSEMNVTVSLDPAANALDSETLDGLLQDLKPHCTARLIGPCAAVSLVGRSIRAIMHQLGPALAAFEEQRIHLVSQAASDLNLTFVVDEDQAKRLVQRLHRLVFGAEEYEEASDPDRMELAKQLAQTRSRAPQAWWHERREELLAMAEDTPLYVYDGPSLDAAAGRLLALENVETVLYSVKANPHAGILERFVRAGLGLECVSAGEVSHVRRTLPEFDTGRILFTPNFAPRSEYREALEAGTMVTLDNLHPLVEWPEEFEGRELFVRIDPGVGRGHHAHVRTAGAEAKFGVALDRLPRLREAAEGIGARIVGLHAHSGSGILDADSWADVATTLTELARDFPDVRILDLGGGLGVPDHEAAASLDMRRLDESLATVRKSHPEVALWLEPGRYLVAEAGVLLVRATQIKSKGSLNYVGVDTGMNSLIRPALYGAWHEIVNLSRLDEPATMTATIVGPICETGDTLGHDRPIAPVREGDVLLIASVGAYGHAMSSRYNLREPAGEILLD
jgi:diaminopimelate decarboxylase/aspartate kinase